MAQYIQQVGVEAVEEAIFVLAGVFADEPSPLKLSHVAAGSTAFKIRLWQGDLIHVLTVHPQYIAHSCEDPQVTRAWLTDYELEDAKKCLSVICPTGSSTPPRAATGPRSGRAVQLPTSQT
jgi:hypothetical protein